jgi:hypothetical protein
MASERLKLTLQFGTENLRCRLRAFTARFRVASAPLGSCRRDNISAFVFCPPEICEDRHSDLLYQNYIAEKVVLRKIIAQKRIAFLISRKGNSAGRTKDHYMKIATGLTRTSKQTEWRNR